MWCDIGATLSGDGIVTVIKASGNGSLKFTIPAGSVGAAAGNFAMNFSRDMSVQFGKGRLIQGCGRDVGPIGMVPSIKRRWGPDT